MGGIEPPFVNGPFVPRNEGVRVRGPQSLCFLFALCVRCAKDALWWSCHRKECGKTVRGNKRRRDVSDEPS